MNIKKLNEEIRKLVEVKAGRAWQGKLKRIDDLIAWMYDKDILTQSDKKKKDSLFHKYYRYYNDGDFPRGIKSVSASEYRWSRTASSWKKEVEDKIEYELEQQLETFMVYILNKYLPKINRKEFHYDRAIEKIHEVIVEIADKYLSLSRLFRLINEVSTDNVEVATTIEKLKELNNEYKRVASQINEPDYGERTLDSLTYGYGKQMVAQSSQEGAAVVKEIDQCLAELYRFYSDLKAATEQAYKISKE